MKIVWLCNMIPSIVQEALGRKAGGGLWVDHVLEDLRKKGVTLHLICNGLEESGTVDDSCSFTGFRGYQAHKYCEEHELSFRRELRAFQPDVIHIWGTEYAHSLAMMNAAKAEGLRERCVISIQGLVGIYAMHYCEGLPSRVRKGYTFRDLLRTDNIDHQVRRFCLRGGLEEKALRLTDHIIGRTEWDLACAKRIAPDAEYHFCSETLRDPFYDGVWSYGSCQKHRIFASSCAYPVKGFHYLLEAFAEVLKDYPDATLAVPGSDFVHLDTPEKKLREDSYHRYMRKIILEHGMEDKILFLGHLSPGGMKEQYLRANVFVMPSTIENSPNSLGEAMLLGTPCVASDVGGITSMMTHGAEGFVYQSTAPYMMAHYIKKVFALEEAAEDLGRAAAAHARVTHDPRKNLEDLLAIYEKIGK